MDELEREELNPDDGQQWIVRGPKGAIVFWRQTSRDEALPAAGEWFGPIGLHSRVPMFKHAPDPQDGCEYLDGDPCYSDSGYGAGQALGNDYIKAQRDPEVIWTTLEQWYRDRLEDLDLPEEDDLDETFFKEGSLRTPAEEPSFEGFGPVDFTSYRPEALGTLFGWKGFAGQGFTKDVPEQGAKSYFYPRVEVKVSRVSTAAEAEEQALGKAVDFFKSPRVRLATQYSLRESTQHPGKYSGVIMVECYADRKDKEG